MDFMFALFEWFARGAAEGTHGRNADGAEGLGTAPIGLGTAPIG